MKIKDLKRLIERLDDDTDVMIDLGSESWVHVAEPPRLEPGEPPTLVLMPGEEPAF